jgi:predicted DNA-binding WGR domain protein
MARRVKTSSTPVHLTRVDPDRNMRRFYILALGAVESFSSRLG